jgi:hypothetical protein
MVGIQISKKYHSDETLKKYPPRQKQKYKNITLSTYSEKNFIVPCGV